MIVRFDRWYRRLMERWAGLRCPICGDPKDPAERYCSDECGQRDAENQAFGY